MTLAELGAKLREAREGRDMTVADVADRLKIPTRILQGIENGSDTLPRTVYVHHFIKEYALLLGFAQEEVTEWLRGLEGFEGVSHPVIAESTTYTSVKPSILPVILGGVFKIVLVLALASGAYMAYLHFFAARDYESVSVSGAESASSSAMPTWGNAAPAPVPAPQASETPAAPEPSVAQPEVVQNAAPAPEAAVSQPESVPASPAEPAVVQNADAPASAAPAGDEQPAALPDGMHQVEVIADAGDCWMGFEPDGKKQQRTLRRGDTFSMSFRDSLVIRLGNARAVRVVYDGKELDRSTSPRVVTMSFPPAE
ncbi:helix-turn-helix domain-containing protein [uncultured Mailhella sp.]|uniref:helix-turn-helix domain-containing protein n=1 Tax=uncultured Mailhella sp. TaxID=1981031 RepID=UPI0025D838FC|nr:helix-turn-helix domain-containing protein [uncultured Mailhella sp.]